MRLTILLIVTTLLVSCVGLPKKPESRRTMLNIYKDNQGRVRAYGDSRYKGKREKITDLLKLDKNICTPYGDYIKDADWMIKVIELLKSEVYK